MLQKIGDLLHVISRPTLGLFLLAGAAQAGVSDLQFGQYQVADSQWNTGNCKTTITCEIYSKIPGTAYQIPFSDGQVRG